MRKLTEKQKRFCEKYIELDNQSLAYRSAYDAENMSDESVRVHASKLMKQEHILAYIAELGKGHQEKHQLTVDDIIGKHKLVLEAWEADNSGGKGVRTEHYINSLKEITKILGLYAVEKLELQGQTQINIVRKKKREDE